MRSVVVLIWLAVACNRTPGHHAAVDKYINEEFVQPRAKFATARAAVEQIAAKHIDEPGRFQYLDFWINQVALPLISDALAGAHNVTPPPAAQRWHADTIARMEALKAALIDMGSSLRPADPERFRRGHAALMSVTEGIGRWEDGRNRMLVDAKVVAKPLPKVPLPTPEAKVPQPP